MLDNLKIAFSGAIAVIVYQIIRGGLAGIDWLSPIVVGVTTLIVFSLLSSVLKTNRQLLNSKFQ